VVIPPEVNVIARYPIAAVKDSRQPVLAGAFIELVLSAEGQRRLVAAGFLPREPVRAR
jgi:molybdate transport system substrate-binding protein